MVNAAGYRVNEVGRMLGVSHPVTAMEHMYFLTDTLPELAALDHVPNEQLYLVWRLLNDAGRAFRLSHFGLYAAESMRLEKGFLHWKAELSYERNPFEAGLARFVRLDKADFVGKTALLAQLERGPRQRLVSLVIDGDLAPAARSMSLFSANATAPGWSSRCATTPTSDGCARELRELLSP